MNLIALIATITSIVVFYFIGHILSFILRIKPYSDFAANAFVKTVLGLLFCVFVCAVICTRGNTVLWGIQIVGLLCWFNNRDNNCSLKIPENKELFAVAIIIAFSLVSFFYQAWHFYNPPYNNIPHADYGFYGVLGELMKEHHTESTVFVSNLFSESNTATPYHYLDSWFGVFIGSIFSMNTVESLYVVVYPILFAMYAISIVVIARTFTSNKIIQLISLFSLFFYPFAWFDFTAPLKEILIPPHFLGYNAFFNPKTEIIALLFALAFVVFRLNQRNFFVAVLLLPVASSVLAPAIFLGLGIFFLLNMIKKTNTIQYNIVSICGMLMVSVFILGFYVLQPKGVQAGEYSVSTIGTSLGMNMIVIIKSCIKLLLFFVIFHLPFILSVAIIKIKDKNVFVSQIGTIKDLIILTLLFCFCGFVFSQICQGLDNASQFYTTVALSLPLVYDLIIVALLSSNKNKFFKYGVALFMILLSVYSLINIHTHPYANDIRKAHKNPYSLEYLSEIQHYSDFLGASFSASFCPHFLSQTDVINLRISSIKDALLTTNSNSFTDYVLKNKHINAIDSLQLSFCQEHTFHFLILEKNEQLPDIFVPKVDTIYIDRNTGERFVVLKQE